jgi:hypothetical protein
VDTRFDGAKRDSLAVSHRFDVPWQRLSQAIVVDSWLQAEPLFSVQRQTGCQFQPELSAPFQQRGCGFGIW